MTSSYARNRRIRRPAWYIAQRAQRGTNPAPYKGGRAARNARRHKAAT